MYHLFSILDKPAWYAAIRVCKKWYNIGVSDYVIQKIFKCQNYKELIEQTKKKYYIYNNYHNGIFKTYLGTLHIKTYSGIKTYYKYGGIKISHVNLSQFMIIEKSHAIILLNFYKKNEYLEQIKTDKVKRFSILGTIGLLIATSISAYYIGRIIRYCYDGK